MNNQWTRRDVIRGSTTAAAAAAGLSGLTGNFSTVVAQTNSRRLSHADDRTVHRLADLIIATEPDRLVDSIANELDNGLSRQNFLAANFVAGARYLGHHYAYVAHPVSEMAGTVPVEMSLLPLFYHLSALKDRKGREQFRAVDESRISSIKNVGEAFDTAMKESDHETATSAFLALAREDGPRRAYDRLWRYGAGRNHRSGGHTAISVVNTFRTLQAIDWRCCETALQFAVEDSAVGKVSGSDLHAVNWERAAGFAELPKDWANAKSHRETVLDLLAMYREGRPDDACRRTLDLLRQRNVGAGTVWDAVFLATAELMARYMWVGSRRLAGHSITCVNALHFTFRTVADPAMRLYAMLEAVEWTNSFLNRERARPALRERSIIDVEPAELTAEDRTPERIFATIPIRRRRQTSPILLPQADCAHELAFAWAKDNADHTPFFDEAVRLLCLNSTTEVHDFKYPLALFENYRFASPEWKPHLLAASTYIIHGTKIEGNPMVAQAQERLQK